MEWTKPTEKRGNNCRHMQMHDFFPPCPAAWPEVCMRLLGSHPAWSPGMAEGRLIAVAMVLGPSDHGKEGREGRAQQTRGHGSAGRRAPCEPVDSASAQRALGGKTKSCLGLPLATKVVL